MNKDNNILLEPVPNLGGVVLCGGQSSRMGVNKSQLALANQTFLERVVERVGIAAQPLVVVGEVPAGTTKIFRNTLHARDEHLKIGPLEGIRVGLKALANHVEFAFVTGCDVPLLLPELIVHLKKLIGNHQAVVPAGGSRVYGLTAIYRTDIVDSIQRRIAAKQFSVQGLIENLDVLKIDVDSLREIDPQLNSLININTPAEYQDLLSRANIF